MFEKDLKIAFLLDFYGEVLSDRKRTVLDYYYNDDLSLAEIAQEIGISRQGVRELIKKAEEELRFYEEKLGLATRFRRVQDSAARLQNLLDDAGIGAEIQEAVKELAQIVGS
ncbi:MAG: winged helix-turn-helix transcriptional regulator [Ruminococcaceae bacterium]|nr:winged helix-turn-helix transcriptional regulator [Oscillospiraceae bacterium]